MKASLKLGACLGFMFIALGLILFVILKTTYISGE